MLERLFCGSTRSIPVHNNFFIVSGFLNSFETYLHSTGKIENKPRNSRHRRIGICRDDIVVVHWSMPPRCIFCRQLMRNYDCLMLKFLHVSDINECADPSIAARCVPNAECCNLPAHFLCKCKPGFEGDGEIECRGKSWLNFKRFCWHCLCMWALWEKLVD